MLTRSLEKTGGGSSPRFYPLHFPSIDPLHFDPPVIPLISSPASLFVYTIDLTIPPPPPLPPPSSRSSFPTTLRSTMAGRRRATSYPIPTATDLNWNLDRIRWTKGTSRLRSLVDVLRATMVGKEGAEDTEIVDRIVPLTTSIRSNHRGMGFTMGEDEEGWIFGRARLASSVAA